MGLTWIFLSNIEPKLKLLSIPPRTHIYDIDRVYNLIIFQTRFNLHKQIRSEIVFVVLKRGVPAVDDNEDDDDAEGQGWGEHISLKMHLQGEIC